MDFCGFVTHSSLLLLSSALWEQVPGQRTLALHLLFAVLDKALHNLCQGQVGCTVRNSNKSDDSIDWRAVWAYALGPEPELVLSLR